MKTKIVATIGPACNSFTTLKRMSTAGVSIFRINTKYGSQKSYTELLQALNKIECKVLFDIKGEKKIKWIKEQKFDYLAVSFAETATQIERIRKEFNNKRLKIIAKIESKKGLRNLDELIKSSDGIMVARGDLGRNTPFERLPIVQKLIIRQCNKAGKFDITATEMLLSMTDSKIPERAEVSDVANAILDGSDAVMLSEETAIGKYPVLVVQTMRRIIEATEKAARKLK